MSVILKSNQIQFYRSTIDFMKTLRNFLTAITALSCLGLTSCHPEKNYPTKIGGGNQLQPYNPKTGEYLSKNANNQNNKTKLVLDLIDIIIKNS